MSKRVDILSAFYTSVSTMTKVAGYSYDWKTLKSVENGSLAPYSTECNANFEIGNEESSQNKGQSLYYITAPLYVKAFYQYDGLDVDDNDYYIEEVRSRLIEDLRKRFGFEVRPVMCQAGLNELNYIGEIDAPEAKDYIVAVQLEFEIRWYDRRN